VAEDAAAAAAAEDAAAAAAAEDAAAESCGCGSRTAIYPLLVPPRTTTRSTL